MYTEHQVHQFEKMGLQYVEQQHVNQQFLLLFIQLTCLSFSLILRSLVIHETGTKRRRLKSICALRLSSRFYLAGTTV